MLQRLGLARLGVMLGVLYWPAESLLHAYVLGHGAFMDSLFNSDANELWMRSLISFMFAGFGFYAQRAIDAQQHLQKRLRKKSQRLVQIIDCTYDAYVSMDEQGVITGWNRSAEALFGWPRQQALGQPVDIIIPDQLRQAHHQGMQQYGQNSIGPWLYKPVQSRALHRDGSEMDVEMVVTPINADGNKEFFAFIRSTLTKD